MKPNRIFVIVTALLILTAVGASISTSVKAQGKQSPRTREVSLYFPKDGDSPDPQNNPSNLQPVKRSVNAAAPLRPAIEALLKGPTAAEQRQGFSELDVKGVSIVKVAVRRGTAYASFVRRRGTGWAGDLSPFAFKDAVERTLRQFPNVSRAIVCVDGIVNFGDLSGGPDRKCPKF